MIRVWYWVPGEESRGMMIDRRWFVNLDADGYFPEDGFIHFSKKNTTGPSNRVASFNKTHILWIDWGANAHE